MTLIVKNNNLIGIDRGYYNNDCLIDLDQTKITIDNQMIYLSCGTYERCHEVIKSMSTQKKMAGHENDGVYRISSNGLEVWSYNHWHDRNAKYYTFGCGADFAEGILHYTQGKASFEEIFKTCSGLSLYVQSQFDLIDLDTGDITYWEKRND